MDRAAQYCEMIKNGPVGCPVVACSCSAGPASSAIADVRVEAKSSVQAYNVGAPCEGRLETAHRPESQQRAEHILQVAHRRVKRVHVHNYSW